MVNQKATDFFYKEEQTKLNKRLKDLELFVDALKVSGDMTAASVSSINNSISQLAEWVNYFDQELERIKSADGSSGASEEVQGSQGSGSGTPDEEHEEGQGKG